MRGPSAPAPKHYTHYTDVLVLVLQPIDMPFAGENTMMVQSADVSAHRRHGALVAAQRALPALDIRVLGLAHWTHSAPLSLLVHNSHTPRALDERLHMFDTECTLTTRSLTPPWRSRPTSCTSMKESSALVTATPLRARRAPTTNSSLAPLRVRGLSTSCRAPPLPLSLVVMLFC